MIDKKQPISYSKEDPKSIQALFDAIAESYDTTNSIMSFNIHSYWNNTLVNSLFNIHKETKSILDLCAGTGDITKRLLARAKQKELALSSITLCDFSEQMLKVAKKRLEDQHFQNITYTVADAHMLPFQSAAFDSVLIAYGVRNLHNPEKAFHEIYRILEKDGIIAILELTRPSNKLLYILHSWYLRFIIPIIGAICSKNKGAYKYLSESISHFISSEDLQKCLLKAKFKPIYTKTLFGGIATLIFAKK